MILQDLIRNEDFLLFDLDGTLANTEPFHWEAYREVFRGMGIHITDEYIYKNIGKTDIETCELIKKDFNVEFNNNEILKRRIDTYLDLVEKSNIKTYNFITDILNTYRNHRMGILSNSSNQVIDKMLKLLGIEEFFEDKWRISAHGSKFTKEHYLKNIREYYGCTHSECILFEDNEHNIEIGNRYGIRCVGVKHIFNKDRIKNCIYILGD